MKFTSASTTLALAFAAVTSSADARIGHQKYTLFFSNQCSNPVPVEVLGYQQTIQAHTCHTFHHGKQYHDSVYYREWMSPQLGKRIHCSEIGHSAYCNESGLPDQACVILIENCFAPQGPPPTNTGTFDDDTVAAPTNTGTFDDDTVTRRNLAADDTPADTTDETLTGTMTGTYDGDTNASDPNAFCPGNRPHDGVSCVNPVDYLQQVLDAGHTTLRCPYTDDHDRAINCDCKVKQPVWVCGRE